MKYKQPGLTEFRVMTTDPNLWWHHGIAENSVMGSQTWYQCKCHQRDTGNLIVIIKWYIGYQHCHYCIYVGVWFFNVNSHNSFINITLHIYEHVTQPLPLNLPFVNKQTDTTTIIIYSKSINVPSLPRQNDWFVRGIDAIAVSVRRKALPMCCSLCA